MTGMLHRPERHNLQHRGGGGDCIHHTVSSIIQNFLFFCLWIDIIENELERDASKVTNIYGTFKIFMDQAYVMLDQVKMPSKCYKPSNWRSSIKAAYFVSRLKNKLQWFSLKWNKVSSGIILFY